MMDTLVITPAQFKQAKDLGYYWSSLYQEFIGNDHPEFKKIKAGSITLGRDVYDLKDFATVEGFVKEVDRARTQWGYSLNKPIEVGADAAIPSSTGEPEVPQTIAPGSNTVKVSQDFLNTKTDFENYKIHEDAGHSPDRQIMWEQSIFPTKINLPYAEAAALFVQFNDAVNSGDLVTAQRIADKISSFLTIWAMYQGWVPKKPGPPYVEGTKEWQFVMDLPLLPKDPRNFPSPTGEAPKMGAPVDTASVPPDTILDKVLSAIVPETPTVVPAAPTNQIPPETQGLIAKILNGLANIINSLLGVKT